MRVIPGTTLKYVEQARNEAFSVVSPVLEATGGLTLSQLSKLTGIEGSTIQNWIKRGWVASTIGKKYSEKQVIRILLINMLRGIMKLEEIAKLMVYVNGDVEDTSDDIIDDVTLYNILCNIIFEAEDKGAFERRHLSILIEESVRQHASSVRYGADKLKKAMMIMILAYRGSYIKSEMEKEIEDISEEFKLIKVK